MIKDLKTVFFYLLSEFFDFFEDPVRMKIIDDIRVEALDIKREADYFYDNECIAVNDVYSDEMKSQINRLVAAYNAKATEYNNKNYWYKVNLQPLPNWK